MAKEVSFFSVGIKGEEVKSMIQGDGAEIALALCEVGQNDKNIGTVLFLAVILILEEEGEEKAVEELTAFLDKRTGLAKAKMN